MSDATNRAKQLLLTIHTENRVAFSSVQGVLRECIDRIEELTRQIDKHQKVYVEDMTRQRDRIESLEAAHRLLKSGTGCWNPKDCCHAPETSGTQSCCDWCLARHEVLAALDKEHDPCAEGHDFVGTGTAICADCGERADVSETGAARSALNKEQT